MDVYEFTEKVQENRKKLDCDCVEAIAEVLRENKDLKNRLNQMKDNMCMTPCPNQDRL
jgi:hypothetical protein